MGVSWTEEQKQVIELRDRNLLVSAAAGSGKTAVLVERIIQKITDENRPVDIDRLLVVTFTNAAAAEMRERVRIAIEKRMKEDPENENLVRQASLIHNARICTIDSFCSFVVRNHFAEIDLDPNIRVADSGETTLLEQDIMNDLFEQEYVLGRSAFVNLVDTYSNKRSDQPVKDMVAKIHKAAKSCPWPEEWIRGLADLYTITEKAALMEHPVMKGAARTLLMELINARETLKHYLELASGANGMPKYVPQLEADCALFENLDEQATLEELIAFLDTADFPSLPRIGPKENLNPEMKNLIMDGRNALKKELAKLAEVYREANPELLLAQAKRQQPMVAELIRLTLAYRSLLAETKRKKHLADFADMEHYALQILVDPTPGNHTITRTADEFRRYYEEIMIDEYQDSNQVQEEILTAISRIPEGVHNMFMVGDVKQSIYRFRQACPELFMEKYASYTTEDSNCRKIELHKNFRSRNEVLDFTNDMFYKLMAMDLGGVAYDDAAALYPGAVYPESSRMQAEVLLMDKSDLEGFSFSEDEAAQEEDKQRLEARLVASRISRLMAEEQVTDKATGELRPIRLSDIVILLRSVNGWGTAFQEVLESCGIPAHVESKTGYFSAYEVQTVLNYLKLLDNPYQDIPMASVLHSPIGGMTDEELADLRAACPDGSFSAAVIQRMREPQENELTEFGRTYDRLRELSGELPIHELLQHLLEDTGYASYVGSMPYGEKRSANLDMLLEKAMAYEKTSYKGLFHFVRYIEQLEKYEQDYGEADVTGENADVVHIMTIHKSKGLEFPVVFVSSMAKKFNMKDNNDLLIIHPKLGLGIPEITSAPKIRRESLFRNEMIEQLKNEALGEELRILYVALTRAKEKLILTGVIDDKTSLAKKYTGNVRPKEPLPYEMRHKAGGYIDWIIPAVFSYPDRYALDFGSAEDLILETVDREAANTIAYERMMERISRIPAEKVEEIKAALSYVYPFGDGGSRKSKYSVSDLKHASMAQKYDLSEGEAELPEFLKEEHISYVPDFAVGETGAKAEGAQTAEKVPAGALRGTAVHRVMECMDFAAIAEIDPADPEQVAAFVREELARMTKKKELTADMRKLISPSQIEKFVASPVALRMAKADKEGLLFKEKPFVMTYTGPVSGDEDPNQTYDPVLIQGIIDVFWFEENHIVLLDYKTDRIAAAEELVMRYEKQLELYADALNRIFAEYQGRKMQVTDKLLYSFSLQEEIIV